TGLRNLYAPASRGKDAPSEIACYKSSQNEIVDPNCPVVQNTTNSNILCLWSVLACFEGRISPRRTNHVGTHQKDLRTSSRIGSNETYGYLARQSDVVR